MNVRTICLSVLFDGEATGYEIRKLLVEGEYSYFIEASFGSIYPALAKLETDGAVTARIEQQAGKPAKKIYSISPEGRREFIGSLFDKLGEDEFRSEFLLFARFVPELPASLVQVRLTERLASIDGAISEMERMATQHTAPADCWVLEYGRTCLVAARNYIKSHMGELLALAKPDTGIAEAAE
ncbi:MAG: PadR family transcriptional regulator [Devosia sp.]